ncbi:MAG TPA: transcriptional regulator [Aliiroseovarius sp.]|nr:transcriptional regulator [Aliiroseovarius sp.]
MSTTPECAFEAIGETFKALSNEHRLRIMGWLMNPNASFPAQKDGDLVEDGVCVTLLTDKTGLTQPSVTNHMHLLQKAGLVSSKRKKNWVFYKPQPEKFHEVIGALKVLASKAPDHH